jgi:PAS domain S-box-containing protein
VDANLELDWGKSKDKYQTFLVFSLIFLACILVYYFHFVLRTGIIITHFFYIPIILSGVWWKRKALWVPFFLAGILFLADWINPINKQPWVDDLFRSIVFISVSIITIILSEQIEKSRILLESSEKQFRSVVESAIEAIITTDESGKVIFVNKSFEKIFGYAEDEIIGKTFEIIMPPQYREKHGKIFNKLKEKNEDEYFNKTLELTASRKDGTEFPFEMSITSWKVNNQKFITAILRDISERKKAEKTQNILSAIVDGSDDAIIGKDIEGNILRWNHGAEIIYGYKAEEVIGKSVSIIFPPNSDELRQILQEISNGKSIKHYETKRITKQGDIIDISLSVSLIKDFNGKIIGASSIGRDITDQKKAEVALAKSEAQLNMVTSNMADFISQSTLDGSYVYVSPSIKQVMGYEPQEVIGKSILDFIHPDDVEYVSSCMMRAADEGTTQSSQHRYKTADGSYIWIETLGTPLYNRKKSIVGFVCNSRDITQQKNMEDALRESEEKYRSLIESAKDVIAIMDYNGVFLLINKAGANQFNIEPPEILGRSIRDFFPDSYNKQLELIRKVITTREGLETELAVQIEGVELWFSIIIQPLFGPENKIKNVQMIARDITEIKNTQKELELALEDKDLLMKEIFHRVKNNLMVISSLLNLQSRYIKDEEAKGIFKESQNRAHSMAIIHERLYRSSDFKKIDFGDYIRTLANDLYRIYVLRPEKVELEVNVDETMIDINTSIPLGLIINELLSNSMKHGFPGDTRGKITIDFHKIDGDFLLEVRDSGIGIPEDVDIFNTGSLGMQLVTSLTQQINGELEFKRSPETSFRITFPETAYN